LAGPGSVSYMFERVGEIRVRSKSGNTDDEMLELIDLGAKDVEDYLADNIQMYLVYTESPELNTMGTKITQAGYGVQSQGITLKPNTFIKIDDPEIAKKVLDFAGKLEESDDVQKVYANFEISDEVINSN